MAELGAVNCGPCCYGLEEGARPKVHGGSVSALLVERGPSLLKIFSAWVSHVGEGELGKIFKRWSKEGANTELVKTFRRNHAPHLRHAARCPRV